jgi:hypothetical protein
MARDPLAARAIEAATKRDTQIAHYHAIRCQRRPIVFTFRTFARTASRDFSPRFGVALRPSWAHQCEFTHP